MKIFGCAGVLDSWVKIVFVFEKLVKFQNLKNFDQN